LNEAALWEDAAIDDLVQLAARDRRQAERVRKSLRAYLQTREGDAAKLSGKTDQWRLRVGDWRVIFSLDAEGAVHVLRVVNRRDAYE
jgi:mRNA interferase RelE/StbE